MQATKKQKYIEAQLESYKRGDKMSNNVPVLMLRGANGKFFPVAGITGGGGGGTGGASTAANVSYTNTQLPNVKNVKTALDELISKSHTHDNKTVLDKLSVTGGKLQYDGSDVGLKGDKGDTPVKGVDYWTAADIAEIKSYVDNAILGGEW